MGASDVPEALLLDIGALSTVLYLSSVISMIDIQCIQDLGTSRTLTVRRYQCMDNISLKFPSVSSCPPLELFSKTWR